MNINSIPTSIHIIPVEYIYITDIDWDKFKLAAQSGRGTGR